MKDLVELRKEIDTIDSELLSLFAQRFSVVSEVGEYKKLKDIPVRDNAREQIVIEKLSKLAQNKKISETFVHEVWRAIFKESYALES